MQFTKTSSNTHRGSSKVPLNLYKASILKRLLYNEILAINAIYLNRIKMTIKVVLHYVHFFYIIWNFICSTVLF